MKKTGSLLQAFSENKNILWLFSLAAIGVLLLLFGGGEGDKVSDSSTEDSYYSVRFYTEEMENRIESLCRQIKGITEVHVLLTIDGASEYIYAENEAGTARDYVIVQGEDGENPVQICEIYPKIRGVAVVCTRGGDSEIQRTITELLSAALGISSSRIRVAGT